MKKIVCLMLFATIIFALSACGGNDDPTVVTIDEKPTISTVDEVSVENSAEPVVFGFSDRSSGNICFVNGSVYIGNDTGIYLADNGEMKKISEAPVYRLCSVSDTVYYTVYSVTEKEEYHELHSVNADGSDDKVICRIEDESLVDFIMRKDDKIYLTCSVDTISVYDMDDGALGEAFCGYFDSVYAVGDKIYYAASESITSPKSIYCYDTVEDKAKVISDKGYDNCALYLNGDDLYVTFDFDNSDNSGSCDIYKIDTQTDGIDKVCSVSVDDSLLITDIINDTVFYQNYSEKDGRFRTFTVSLPDGDIKEYESVDYRLTKDDDNGNNVCCFSSGSRKYTLVYDFDEAVFKSTDINSNDSLFFDESRKEYCGVELDEGKTPAVSSVTLSDDLPKSEDMYIGSESSPDNEYLKLNKIYIDRIGSCFWIPELTLGSDDAERVNNELESAEFYGYGQYYKSEIHDNYLTFYTLVLGDSSSRTYKLYTFDVTTGKQLDNDEIIALVAYDKDDFYSAIKDRLYEIQDDIFKGRGTDIENRNENKEPSESVNGNDSITDDMYDYALSEDRLDDMQFGYAGNGKLLCVSSFRNIAGGYATDHLFEFGY